MGSILFFFGWLMTHDALAEDPRRSSSSASAEHVVLIRKGGQRNKLRSLY
jgi:hypothetical protein